MKLNKMRFVPLLVLLLCTAMLFSISAMAAAVDSISISGFAYADLIDVTATEYSSHGTLSSCSSTVTLGGEGNLTNAIQANATGYVTYTEDDCGNQQVSGYYDCITTVKLTAKADIAVTYSVDSNIQGFAPYGALTTGTDGSKTFYMPKGASVEFFVQSNDGDRVSGTFTFTKVEAATNITVPGDCATYLYGGAYYSYFDQVLAAAETSGGTIVVVNSGKVYDSSVATDKSYASKTFTYTIPSNVNLLIPYNKDHTLITNNMDSGKYYTLAGKNPAKSLYRQLTMPSGIKFEVEGGISVGSQASSQMVGQVGPYGAIKMDKGSSITVKSGGNLYAYGYIFYGANDGGTVTVESGGKVYETAFIMDYPGSATNTVTLYYGASGRKSSLSTEDKSKDGDELFPMRAYTVRNVEVPMTLESGATETAFYSIYGSAIGGEYPGYFSFIGTGTSAPFSLGTGATLTKSYSNGVQSVVIDGDLAMNPLQITLKISTFGSFPVTSSYTTGFPLPSGFDVTVASGTMTLNDNIIMLEGTKITVDAGAAVNSSGKNFFVLDATEDTGSVSVKDVHGKSYTTVNTDAVLDINGTINVTGGGAYTSASHAQIISSEGTGKIVCTDVNLADVATYVRVKNSTNKINPTMNSAYLLNGDGTYTQTGAGAATNTYVYLNNKWVCATHTDADANGTCDACASAMCDHSTLTEVAAVPAGCETSGTIAHYVCSCGMMFNSNAADKKALSGAELAVRATGHQTLTPYPAAESTCSKQGNSAYWQCEGCKLYFSDAEGKTKIEKNAWLLPLAAHTPGEAATCTTAQTCTKCGAEITAELGHKAVTVTGKAATCLETGLTDGSKCERCGITLTAQTEIPALGHSMVTDKAVAPTCTATGLTEGSHCSRCNDATTAQTVVDALGHDMVIDKAVAPTCTATGLTEGSHCSRCSDATTAQTVVAALGHELDAGEITKNPTCTATGTKLFTCERCGHTEVKILDTVAHNYGEWSTVTAATCVATGEKSRTCSACGHEETEVIAIDPEAHTGVNHTENAEEATCTKAGYTGDTVCECGVIVAAGEEISTVAHNYGEWSIVIEETCMEAGEKSRTCSACGHEETEVIAATGHVDTTETVVNATCTTDGSKTVTCSCGEVVSTETITATGHKGTLVNAQAATCVGSGYNAYYDCANCDMYFTDAECKDAIDDLAAWKTTEGMGYIPAKGHMYNRTWEWTEEGEYTLTLVCSKCETYTKDHKVVKTGTGEVYEKTEPGCETMGTVKYSVSVEVGGRNYENISRIFDLAATGHNKVAIPAVDATCTTAGSTAGVKCSVCGKVLEEPEEVPVAGHDWTEATCVAPKTCKTCGATEGEPAGHSYDEGVITQAPTYATAGIKTVTCTADGCGYSTTENMKVAEVDGVQYEILKDALTSVSDGGTITLLADFADTETITISQAVTINKNGKTATIAAGSGFKATATGDIVTIQKNLWRIYNSNMDLENSLGMIFWVKKANIQEGVDYYALVTKYAEDGSTKQVKIMLSEWQDYSSEYYRFTFDGIAAKEMTDTIEAQVFYAADDTPASRVYTDSVQAYAMYMLEGYTSGPWATLMVDMLNYGAAAQREFGHNLSNLANSQLTATQQKLATQSVTMNDNWEGGALYYNTVLNLENNIILTLLFKDLTSDMYAAISYENFQGELVEYTIPFESFDKRNDNIYAINVDTLVVADGRQVVSCEIYNGAHQPVGSCKDSIEGYLSVMKGNDPNGLYVATMKFIDSACVAFKPK